MSPPRRCVILTSLIVLSVGLLPVAGLVAVPHVDAFGDPLPPGARARLGTTRYRVPGYVTGTALSPDGATLAVGVNSEAIHLLDAATGRLRRRLTASGIRIAGLAFVDGGRGLIAPDYGQMTVWDLATALPRPLPRIAGRGLDHGSPLTTADGQTFILTAEAQGAAQGGTVSLVDVATGQVRRSWEVLANRQIGVAVTADGTTLATWGHYQGRVGNDRQQELDRGRTIQLWEAATGREIRRWLVAGPIQRAAFAPDGGTLAVADYAGLALWDPATGQERCHFASLRGSGAWLGFSPDGGSLVAATADGTVQRWDAATGRRQGISPPGPGGLLGGLAFPPASPTLAWSLEGTTVHLWEVPDGRRRTPVVGHRQAVADLAFTPDGRRLRTAEGAGRVLEWDAQTGTLLEARELRDPDARRSGGSTRSRRLTFSPDGSFLLTKGDVGSVALRLWRLPAGTPILDLPSSVVDEGPAAFSGDGTWLALAIGRYGGGRGLPSLRLWEVPSGIEKPFPGPRGNLAAVAFAPDGRLLATAENQEPGNRGPAGPEVRLWDLATGQEVVQLADTTRCTAFLTFTPDGRALITADRSGGLACWQVPSGKPLGRVSRTDAMITCPVACAPDGLTWAVGWQTRAGADCRVQLWEAATCQVRKEWPGHGGTITALAFAPDGRTLASGSADTTILLWDLRADLAAARRHHPRLTPEEAAAQWGLLSGDAATAYPAQLRFAVAPADALAFLRDRLPPVPGQPPTPETLARWVADLGAEAFAVREQAARALDQAGDAAEPALRQALAGRPREEVRRRLEALLDRPPGTPSPETLRGLRAVEALEWAAPAEARAWLAALARGNPAAALTRAAQAAHRRLEPAAKER